FPFMILMPLAQRNSLLSLRLESWSLAVNLCICFHKLLDEDSMMRIKVFTDQITVETYPFLGGDGREVDEALRTMLYFECYLFSNCSGVSFIISVMMGVGLLTGASLSYAATLFMTDPVVFIVDSFPSRLLHASGKLDPGAVEKNKTEATLVLMRLEEVIDSPGTEIADGCKLFKPMSFGRSTDQDKKTDVSPVCPLKAISSGAFMRLIEEGEKEHEVGWTRRKKDVRGVGDWKE
ncbi:hypothetical protein STEG23_025066, partial [Scotinomys teguina]